MKKLIPVLLILLTLLILSGCQKDPVIETFTVTFDPDNGTARIEKKVEKGKTVEKIQDPEKTGCEFMEWRTPDGEEYDFTKAVESDITLKAVYWKEMHDSILKKAFSYMVIARNLAGETKVVEIDKDEIREVFVALNEHCSSDLTMTSFCYEHEGTKYYFYDGTTTHANYLYVDLGTDYVKVDEFSTSTDKDITTTEIKNLVIKATCFEGVLDGKTVKKKADAEAFVADGESVTINGKAFYSIDSSSSTALYGFINDEGEYSEITDEKAKKITYYFEDSTGAYIKRVDIPKADE